MHRLTPWVACHIALWCCAVAAQQPGAPEGEYQPAITRSEAAADPVEEVQPPVYYLKDKSGKLVPMFGFTLEDFLRVYNRMEGMGRQDRPPRYVLQRMSAVGTARANVAELTVRFDVLLQSDAPVRVPLRMDRAVLRGKARYEGPGRQFLVFEEDGEGGGEGYVSWIHGKPGDEHHITLNVLVPLVMVGDETRLRLRVPRATQSELKLTVPPADAVGKVSEGATVRTSPAGEGERRETEFTIVGLDGDFALAWHASDLTIATPPRVLEAVGEVLVRLDKDGVNTEATLRVRGHGAALDGFRVRLPKGAQLLQGSPSGYTPSGYTVVPIKAGPEASRKGQVVQIKLSGKTADPPPIRLAVRQPYTEAADWVELAGFEVLGAARQSGHIAVEVARGLYVLWGPRQNVRQVDEVPDTLHHKDLLAGFEYFSQPCSLTAKVVPRRTHIGVEPEYLLLVDAKQVRLEATLRYTVRGAKAFFLEVELSDWEIDEVGPESLVAVDAVQASRSKVLWIPLSYASTGRMEVTIQAHRPIPPGTKSLRLTLPRPRATSPGPAAVVVQPADNVQLTPDTEAMVGLVRQQVRPPMELPQPRQQDPLFYRGEGTEAAFVADFRIRRRAITTGVTSHVTLEGGGGRVQQKLAYRIDHEPLEKFTIDVPRELAQSDALQFELDGKEISPTALADQPVNQVGADDPRRPVRMWIALPPASQIGSGELVVRYPLPPRKLTPKSEIVRKIPLVMPGEGDLSENRLIVTAPPEFTLRRREGPWTVPDGHAGAPRREGGLELSAPERTHEVVLAVELEDRNTLAPTIVRRAWVQTWLTRTARQDRAVFRFSTSRKEIELTIPDGAADQEVDLWLDGKSVMAKTAPDGSLMVPLSGEANNREHLLEATYHFPDARPPRGRFSVEIAGLGRDAWVRRMYWQLILPRDEHVIAGPEGLVHEFRWGWDGVFWGRTPLLEQPELETWVGASRGKDQPEAANCYLFSSLGKIPPCTVRTAGRSWIVLWASLAALAAGLSLIYVPASRHPATLFVGAVLLVGAWVLFPEPTVLVLQAASLGLVLALLAGLLQRGLARRRRGVTLLGTSISVLEKDSTQTQYRPEMVGGEASTETAAHPPEQDDASRGR